MITIRQGRPEDFPTVMEQVVQSFRERNPAHIRFEALQPDAIGPSMEKMATWRLAEVDGQVAAGIQIIPQRLKLGEAEVPVGGIGNVYCWMPYRSHGCFSALIQRCVHDMTAKGDLISLLGGDRTRYGHYGWEIAGGQRDMSLSSHIRRHENLGQQPHATEFRVYHDGNLDDATRMFAAYSQKTARVLRPGIEGFRATMRRPGLVTYIHDADGCFGYMTVAGGNRIAEYAGDVAAVEKLLRFLLQSGSWSVSLPPVELSGPVEDMFLSYAAGYNVSPCGMLRVNDVVGLLNAFRGLLSQRLRSWSGMFTRGVADGEAVTVTCVHGQLNISAAAATVQPDLVLNRRQMAQLLFGPFPPMAACAMNKSWIRLAFPLPIYWGRLDHI